MPSVSANVQKVLESLSTSGISQEDMIDSLLTAANTLAAKTDGELAGGPGADVLAEQISVFVARYPLDERAYDYLTNSPNNVIATVINTFSPPREGEADYSGLLTSFLKRTRGGAAGGKGASMFGKGAAPFSMFGKGGAPQQEFGFGKGGGKGFTAKGGLLRDSASSSAPKRSAAEMSGEVQTFVQRYPIDERALDYLGNLPTAAQQKVVRDFKPKHEGESDYSSLVTSYIKRVIAQGYAAEDCDINLVAPPDITAAKWTPGLDEFLAKFPIDERAYDYFAQSSPAVQVKVIKEFRPPREGEASYSGLFTSFVKRIRGEIQASQAHGMWPQTSQQVSLQDIENFFRRYPCDERAREYLSSSTPGVMVKVLTEFTPKREGDADYSAVLTSFIKRCCSDQTYNPGQPAFQMVKRSRFA